MLGLLILAIFVAVALFSLIILNILNHALRQYEQRYMVQGTQNLSEMFIFIDGRQLVLLTVSAAFLLGLLGWVLSGWLLAAASFMVGFLLPFFVLRKLRQRRIRMFDRQLVDVLLQMSAGFRAGLTLPQAAESATQEMPSPICQEFGLLIKELKLGVAQDEALLNLGQRVDSENLQLVVVATNVARKLGGNLAEMYDTISDTVRQRFQIQGKVDSLTSMGRLQAWVVGAMPLVMGLVLNWMRPDLFQPMLASNFGKGLIACVVVLEVIGILIIRKIINIDV